MNRRATGLLVLVALVPFLGLIGSVPVLHDIFVSDLLHAGLPYRAFIGETLRDGHFPLWMPGAFSGVPLLPQIEAGALYPPHLLLFSLFEPFRALTLAVLLDILVAATGAYVLARQAGCSRAASALAGIAFGASGFFVSHVRHPNMHAAAAWLPWLFVAQGRVFSGARAAGPLLALVFGLEIAAGHPQIAYYAGLALVVRGVWNLRSGARAALVQVGALGLGACLLAALLLPTAAFTSQSLGTVEPTWAYASAFPFRWEDLPVLAWPPAVGSMESYDYQGPGSLPWGNYGFAGTLTLLLALAGVALTRGRALGWALAAAVGLALVLGDRLPLYRLLWDFLPGMKLFRFPNRWLLLWILAISQLAALGLDALLAHLKERTASLLSVLAALTLSAELSHHHRPRLPLDRRAEWTEPSAMMEAVDPAQGRVLTVGELDLWEPAFHQARGFLEGPEPYLRPWAVPIGSSGLLFGLRSASGYTRMVHYRTAAFWQRYNESLLPEVHQPEPGTPEWRRLVDRAGIRWVFSADPLEGFTPVGSGPYHLYENPAAMPRIWLAEGWLSASDFPQAAEMVQATEGHLAIVEAVAEHEGGWRALEYTELSPQHLRIELEPHPGGILVFGDSYDPGWSAVVDGTEAPLVHVNGWQMGALLDADSHTVELRYWPERLSEGLALSFAAALSLLIWTGLALRRT